MLRILLENVLCLTMLSLSLVACEPECENEPDTDEVVTLQDYVMGEAESGVATVIETPDGITVQSVNGVDEQSYEKTFPLDQLEISGIVPVATQMDALTTGCFGFDWCVRIDDPSRCVAWIPGLNDGDIVIYGDAEAANPPGGVTYTNNINYVALGGPFNHNAWFGQLTAYDAQSQHGLVDKRNARCASPVWADTCYQE
mgnify:CR=1 FL=1